MMALLKLLATLTFVLPLAVALNNGLALTPPMGWLTWERFRCNTDCENQPDTCISENLIKTMANIMVKEGYLDAGYQYIIIDDCWLARERAPDGSLQPDPKRFPNGIKALADYVHNLGLKFGIYEDFGTETCGGYPGSEFYLMQDANTFAQWGVDYVKFDGCHSDRRDFDAGYEAFGLFLNKTGRRMVYSCEWPLYQSVAGIKPDYDSIARTCNLWRNHIDIQDSWESVVGTIRFYGRNEGNFAREAGPGGWNDPDMLVIGNFGLSYEQSKVQMAMWAMMASPLIMSTDLRNISPEMKAILQNKNLIAINQDPFGLQGTMKGTINGTNIDIWLRTLSGKGMQVIALLQLVNPGNPTLITVKARDIGLTATSGYSLTDAFTGELLVDVKGPDDMLKVLVNPDGVVMFTAKQK